MVTTHGSKNVFSGGESVTVLPKSALKVDGRNNRLADNVLELRVKLVQDKQAAGHTLEDRVVLSALELQCVHLEGDFEVGLGVGRRDAETRVGPPVVERVDLINKRNIKT